MHMHYGRISSPRLKILPPGLEIICSKMEYSFQPEKDNVMGLKEHWHLFQCDYSLHQVRLTRLVYIVHRPWGLGGVWWDPPYRRRVICPGDATKSSAHPVSHLGNTRSSRSTQSSGHVDLELCQHTLINLSPLNLERQTYLNFEENWAQWARSSVLFGKSWQAVNKLGNKSWITVILVDGYIIQWPNKEEMAFNHST